MWIRGEREVVGDGTISEKDILKKGDIWVCFGKSNTVWKFRDEKKEDIITIAVSWKT